MGKALYRQYRSTSFDEVIGQEHITTTLKNSLENGTVAHAYLLTGPRGVGKTSIARILAHAANDLKYEKDGVHLDIIEIDAASNRRIDEIRDLREKVHIAPTSAKYKVYIIDEVHMLTREAFNALLKTLEEPPEHVIFILATTEIHKLPDTIISRCINFNFRPIDTASIVEHLSYIAKREKLDIDNDALELLAIHGDGSFRDSISLLDQVKNINKKITREEIELTLGLASESLIKDIFQAVANHDPKVLNDKLEEAYKHGASELNLAKQLSEHVRKLLINQELPFPPQQATEFLKDLLDVPGSPKPRASLEVCLLNQIFKDSEKPQKVVQSTVKLESKTKAPPKPATHKKEPPKQTKSAPVPVSKPEDNSGTWKQVLQKLKQRNNTLYSIARMAQADLRTGKLILNFKFPFHVKQFTNSKNKAILTSIFEELGQKDLEIEVKLKAADKKEIKKDKSLESINNIFGSSEVLES